MNNYSKTVADNIENLKVAEPEALQAFKAETLKTLAAVSEKLKSEDPLEREEAMLQALEIKALLEKQAKSLSHETKKKKSNLIHLVS